MHSSRAWLKLAVLALSTLAGLCLADLALPLSVVISSRAQIRAMRRAAEASGVPFDGRTKFEVVQDLRRGGVDAYPAIHPASVLRPSAGILKSAITINGLEVSPLAGIANKPTVYCNESGQYLTYDSDEHGFHNPRGLWDGRTIEIAALGDSFTHGACVPSGENLVARIRGRYPSTINLGYGGNGPLLELAVLEEYIAALKPKVILWLFAENDLSDLEREKTSPLLMHYVEPDGHFRQDLIAMQPAIDRALAEYVGIQSVEFQRQQNPAPVKLRESLMLLNLRRELWTWQHRTEEDENREDYGLLQRILEKANRTASSWGGRLYLIYLPSPVRYENSLFTGSARKHLDDMRARVLAVAQSLSIPVLDVDRAFSAHRNFHGRYFYPYQAHYTSDGYGAAAQAVLDFLDHAP